MSKTTTFEGRFTVSGELSTGDADRLYELVEEALISFYAGAPGVQGRLSVRELNARAPDKTSKDRKVCPHCGLLTHDRSDRCAIARNSDDREPEEPTKPEWCQVCADHRGSRKQNEP